MNSIPLLLEQNRQCALCSSTLTKATMFVLASGSISFLGQDIPVHTIMCRNCSFVFQLEIYDHDFAASMYANDKGYDFSNDIKESIMFQKNMLKRQNFLSHSITCWATKHDTKFNILDVGGGLGENTVHLLDDGNVYVIDYNDETSVDDRIVKLKGDFIKKSFDMYFDIIIMNHVLEHTSHPMLFVSKAHALLKAGGLLIIEVPFELYTPLVFGKIGDWRHVCYFTRSSLRAIILKSGFIQRKLFITTGHYGIRNLTVIRCIASKGPNALQSFATKKTVVGGVADCLHPIVLYNGVFKRIFTG